MKILVLANEGSGYHAIAEACGMELVSSMEHADCVMFTGGEDISPELYGEERHPATSPPNLPRETKEKHIFQHCLDNNKPMIGICRGSQFLCAMSGGKLHQHVKGHAVYSGHLITTIDDRVFPVTSTHHQMMDIRPIQGVIPLAAREGPDSVFGFDPEVVWFPLTKCLAVQYHPEYMPADSEGYKYFLELVGTYIKEP
jgi:putative glutamine amidotransferase